MISRDIRMYCGRFDICSNVPHTRPAVGLFWKVHVPCKLWFGQLGLDHLIKIPETKKWIAWKSRAVSTHSPDWSSSSEKSAGKSSGLAARYKYKCNYNCYTTLHNTTLHYTNYIALRYSYYYNCSCNYNCNYHYIALHNTRLITLHFTTTTTTLPYVTLH